MKVRWGGCLAVALLAGCTGGTPPPQAGYIQPAIVAAIPQPLATPVESGEIGIGDTLSLTVFREPDLSLATVLVDPVGNIQVPLLGTRHVAGMSPGAAGSQIQRDLGRYVVSPRVAINITTSVSRHVTVEGEVAQPGIYPYQSGMTLLSAMAVAHGPTLVARTEEVGVLRTTAEGRYLGVFNLGAIRAGQAADVPLQSSDTIVVGRSGRRQFWRDFLSTAPLLGLFTRI